ncbi:SDR family oxidoreductase [uncultured Ruthenibacterium sp.]|uniref:SDR family oxidoreductase n=1 Tax=uncultured Ruthenibacterium sp. TaxID=1905347 RepID=UPI00349E4B59
MKRALFLGGTGTISEAVCALAAQRGWELTLVNRGRSADRAPQGAELLCADVRDKDALAKVLAKRSFDVVADFIAFTPADVQRDIELFEGRTGQYLFISSASAYQKPITALPITESTPLYNPYWKYSQDKIACEDVLNAQMRKSGFPVTIVRPSHTYCERKVPLALHGDNGNWQILSRMKAGKPTIIPGDGTALWTVTHSTDFAKGFVGLMGNPRALGHAVHITSDETLTWNQIYGLIARALGVELNGMHIATDFLVACQEHYDLEGQLHGDKCANVLFDNTKIKRLVPDFVCTVSMEEGIRNAVEYMCSHPECQTPDPAFDDWCDRVCAAYLAGQNTFSPR